MQPLDQLGPPGGVVIYRKALPVRQHLDVQTLLRYVNSTVAMLCHLRAPSLLMRAGALATVREWKKRLERQAHSRSIGRGGCGLPVETGAMAGTDPRHPSLCCFLDIQGGASSSHLSAARQLDGRSRRVRSSRHVCLKLRYCGRKSQVTPK